MPNYLFALLFGLYTVFFGWMAGMAVDDRDYVLAGFAVGLMLVTACTFTIAVFVTVRNQR